MLKKLIDKKNHWEHIYQTREINEFSWIQKIPTTSLTFLEEFNISRSAKIIDIGGGDSYFVDHLLDLGFEDITVLDISETAINKAKKRLGIKAELVKWIVDDATSFKTDEKYDFWRDRAAFHFLTNPQDIENYVNTIHAHMNSNGYLLIGTFSEAGPRKCCGLEIKQYSEETMTNLFYRTFQKIRCISVNHITPTDILQNYVFCSFRKIAV